MRNVRPGQVAEVAQLFHGMLAVLLAITAFMNIVVALTSRRDQLVLKRLRTTRLTDAQILAGQIASTVTQTVGLILLSMVAVRFLADVPFPPDPLLFGAAIVAGSAVMALLGAAYTAAIPRAELAAAYTMPIFLMAGVGAGAMGPIPLPSFVRDRAGPAADRGRGGRRLHRRRAPARPEPRRLGGDRRRGPEAVVPVGTPTVIIEP